MSGAIPFPAHCPPPQHIGRGSWILSRAGDLVRRVCFPRSRNVVPSLRAEVGQPLKAGLAILLDNSAQPEEPQEDFVCGRGLNLIDLRELAAAAARARSISGEWESLRVRARSGVVQSLYLWFVAYAVHGLIQDENNPEFPVVIPPPSGPGPVAPNPFRFSHLTTHFNEEMIENFADEIFMETQKAVERKSLPSSVVEAHLTAIDLAEYLSAMAEHMNTPQCFQKVEILGLAILLDPSVSTLLESARRNKSREIRACHRDDPRTKALIEEIREGGPTSVMRYWNVVGVLYDLGEALGLAIAAPDDKLV